MTKGIPISQTRTQGEKRRQSILHCQAYLGGDRFNVYEAARVLRCKPKATYHVLSGLCRDKLLQSHTEGRKIQYSKPGVDYLKIPWRSISNDELLLDESLGVL
jgi:hypothetical protein